jgi:ketosteroid isomerase-like protein
MTDQTEKRRRGRPPKQGEAMPGADRQRLYAAARQRDMAEVAFALRTALAQSKAERAAFVETYKGMPSGQRLRRGLARILTDEPETMVYFEGLISSDDGK